MSEEAKRLYDEGLPRVYRECWCERCQDAEPDYGSNFCRRCYDFLEARRQLEIQNREYLNRLSAQVRGRPYTGVLPAINPVQPAAPAVVIAAPLTRSNVKRRIRLDDTALSGIATEQVVKGAVEC